MRIEQEGGELVILSPSKVNLFLEVAGKREDGYHELSTVMQAISLHDELRIAPAAGDEMAFDCNHPDVPNDSSNLVLQAAEALRQRSGVRHGARIRLLKKAPVGGGIGGGSGNAAAALIGLNRLWELGLLKSELDEIAASLGSDINFFLEGGTAHCVGRGEVVRPIDNGLDLHYVLVFPAFGVSTARAFEAFRSPLTPVCKDVSIVLEALENDDFGALCQGLYNRLEGPVFRLRPELATIRERLGEVAPGRVLLSGSGSTFYCLCLDGQEAAVIAAEAGRLEVGSVHRAVGLPA